MKNKTIVIYVSCILIIVIFLLFFTKFKNKPNFNDLSIYKREYSRDFIDDDKINISDEEKNTIINYLNNEKFEKIVNNCAVAGIYMIKYDNIEISFDNNSCGVNYKNTHTEENYKTNISEELKNYIINIAD